MNIGLDNQIDDGVIIESNVKIGNNNIIKRGTIIYENTIIGDNNIILEDNRLGVLPVEANYDYDSIKRNGLIIGNNNFFHFGNKISSGHYQKTIIGDNNKFLSEVYICHDNIIHNHVVFYLRVTSCGLVEYFDYSNIGANACIHQKMKIGSYSMIGMNNSITKNVLPFMVCINNKYSRLNHSKIKLEDMTGLEKILLFVKDNPKYQFNELIKLIDELPEEIQKYFYETNS